MHRAVGHLVLHRYWTALEIRKMIKKNTDSYISAKEIRCSLFMRVFVKRLTALVLGRTFTEV